MDKLILKDSFRKYLTEMITQAREEAEWHPIDRTFIEQKCSEIFNIDPVMFIYANFEITTSSVWPITLFLCLPEMWKELEVDDIKLMIESFESIFSFFFLIEFTGKYLQIDILPMILDSENVIANFKDGLVEYLKLQWHVLMMTEATRDSLENDMEGIYLKYDRIQWQEIRNKFLEDNRVQEWKLNFSELKKYLSVLIGEPLKAF